MITYYKLIHSERIRGRDLLNIDQKKIADLKKIPAESQLTTRYHLENTDMLVAGCYRGFIHYINILQLGALGEFIQPGRYIFNLSYEPVHCQRDEKY